jgi:5-hydroxyisourate hydrolase-like protein (transthyretin family)
MPKTNVKVRLVGEDGNAFAILGKVTKALRREGRDDLATEYQKEAMSGDYDNLLRVTADYVEVE